jgi:hypothetical protein
MNSISAFRYTHVRPREGQAIGKLLCFLDEKVVLLPAEFVCADKSCHVADSALKEAAKRHQRKIQLRLQGTPPNSIGGVRFCEVDTLRKVECLIKEVLNSRRLSGDGERERGRHTVSPMMY